MKKERQTKVFLSEEGAELFKWFMKYRAIWEEAREKLKPGSLVIHLDKSGEIGKREFHYFKDKKST